MATSNAGQADSPYLKETPGAVAKNIAIETYVPNRTAQMALINQVKVEFSVPGDPGLSVGRIVTLNLPSYAYDGNPNSSNLDKYFTGKYLVSAVKHTMDKNGIYNCIVEAISDSLSSAPVSGTVNSALTNQLNKE